MKQFATALIAVGLTVLAFLVFGEIAENTNMFNTQSETTIMTTTTEKTPITITTKKEYTHNIYLLNISAVCLQNNSVGYEWFSEFRVDGQRVYDGQKISVPVEVKELIIDTIIRENDKADDVSEKAITLNLTTPNPIKTQIIVTENSGAYKGNTAIWEVSLYAELVGSE